MKTNMQEFTQQENETAEARPEQPSGEVPALAVKVLRQTVRTTLRGGTHKPTTKAS